MNDILVKLEQTSDVEHEEEVSFKSVPADVAINSGKPALFACPECSQAFKTKSSLHYHQRKYRHCSMEPFACALCGKEFGIATHLTSHMRTHTKQRPFFCPLEDCDRVYSRIDLVNVHLIKCHQINYKVKSRCFHDGVFCGQVFINGEMRMIQKVIPDKSAASGIEIKMRRGLAVKMLDNSNGRCPDWHSFDVVDGSAPELYSVTRIFPVASLQSSGHNNIVVDSCMQGLNSASCSTQAPKICRKTPAVNERSDNGTSLNSEKSDVSQRHVKDALNSSCFQDTMNDDVYHKMFNSDDLAKQISFTCSYVDPSVLNPCEFRFSNMSSSSVATVSGFENSGQVVTVSKSGVLPQENGSITIPSIGIAKSSVTKSSGGTVPPTLGTKFPKSLLESNQSCQKKQNRSTRNLMRPPIEIPKLQVKVCIVPNESRYKCPDCEYITDTMPMAILHMRESQHGGMKKKTYRCQICSKKFLLKEAFCQHMKTGTGHSKHAKASMALSVPVRYAKNDVLVASNGNNIASLKNNGCSEIRKVLKSEAVDSNTLIAQPKCAINGNTYNSLATFGNVSSRASLKSSQHENIGRGEKAQKKKKTHSDHKEETKKIKLELGVVQSEEGESINEEPGKLKCTALPGIGTFFSSNFVSWTNTPTTLPSFQTFLGVSTQKKPSGFTPQGIFDSSLSKQMA